MLMTYSLDLLLKKKTNKKKIVKIAWLLMCGFKAQLVVAPK